MIVQAFIILCSATAIWLVGSDNRRLRLLGFTFGLIGQPFWFVATFQAGQWGMLALSLWYTYAWYRGLKNHWQE